MLHKLDLAFASLLGLPKLLPPSRARKRVLNHALLALPLALLPCHNYLKKKKVSEGKMAKKNHED